MRSLLLACSLCPFLLAASSGAQTTPPAGPVVHERKDDKGRLVARVVFNPDGTIHHTFVAYGSEKARLTIDEDLDLVRKPRHSLRERTDDNGRLVEREEASVKDGKKTVRRTKVRYDAQGRPTSETQITEEAVD